MNNAQLMGRFHQTLKLFNPVNEAYYDCGAGCHLSLWLAFNK